MFRILQNLKVTKECVLETSNIILLVLVIDLTSVQLQINHESLLKERQILHECKARVQNLVLSVMTSDLSVIVRDGESITS